MDDQNKSSDSSSNQEINKVDDLESSKESSKVATNLESPSKTSRIIKSTSFKINPITATTATMPISNFSGETIATFTASASSISNPEFLSLIQTRNIKVSIEVPEFEDSKKSETKCIYSIMQTIDSSFYSMNIIKQSIDNFNKLFESKDGDSPIPYRLALNYNNYKLRPSKKNGKPNNDYPCMDSQSPILNTGMVNFSLIYIDEDLIRVQPKLEKCCKCCIF